jgi:hypothetical protein
MGSGPTERKLYLSAVRSFSAFVRSAPGIFFHLFNESMRDLKLRFGALGTSLLVGVFSLFG